MSKPLVEYRRLGKCGLRVSVPILGGMSFGSNKWGSWAVSEEESMAVLKAAWDRGITTIDTANVYSNGESERIIGKFLKKYQIPREKVTILTKCCLLVHETDITIRTIRFPDLKSTRDYVNSSGLSRIAIFPSVDASLERLQTSYIDLLQVHRFDNETSIEETMKALHDLVQSGKVRYIGASSMWTWQFVEMQNVADKNGWTKFVSMQGEYSLLYREEEREMIPYCNYHGIGIIPWGPLHAGDLARPVGSSTPRTEEYKHRPDKQLSATDQTIVNRVKHVAEKRNWKIGQVALAWVCSKVTSPIVGVSTVQRLEEALVSSMELSQEEIEYLEEIYGPKDVRGHE